jgi:chromosome segregation ATPase
MSQKRIVVVLGMHRSGTSAIARGLKVLNVDLGDNLMPGAPGENEKGFWEDLDFYRLNEKLLAKIGSAWDHLRRIDVAPLCREEFAEERFEASALIERKMRSSSVFGFKDPRTTILLPFWQCVFEDLGLEESYVIAVRNPLEVCESLRKRNGFEPSFSMALWLKYTWSAVNHSADRQRVCLSYRNLLSEPAKELARVAASAGLHTATASSPAMIEFVSEFLSAELRHNRISDLEMRRSGIIPAATQALYSALLESAENDAPLNISSKLKAQVEQYLITCDPLLRLGDTLKLRAERSEFERRKEAAGRERAEDIARTQEQRLEELSVTSQRLESEIVTLKSRTAERERQIEALTHAETLAQDANKDVRTQIDRATFELDQKDEQISGLQEKAEALGSLNFSLSAEREQLRSTVAQLEEQVAAISASESKANLQFAELEQRLHERKRHIEALTLSETAARSDLRDLRLRIEKSSQILSEKDRQISELAESFAESQKKTATLQEKVDRLQHVSIVQTEKLRAQEKLQIEATEARAEASELRSLLEKSRNELIARGQQVESIEAEAAAARTEASELRSLLETSRNELIARGQQVESIEAEAAAARTEASELRSLLETSRNELIARGQQIESIEAQTQRDMANVRAQLESVTQSLSDRSEKLALNESRNHQLTSDLQEKSKNLRLARGQLASLRDELDLRDQQIAGLTAGLESSARVSAERDAEIQRLQIRSDAASARIRALESSEVTAQSKLADLSLRLESANKDASDRQNTVSRFQEQLLYLQELKSKLADAERQLAAAEVARQDGELARIDVTTQMHRLQTETAQKTKELRLLRHEVLALRTSTSWRVTKPLRSLRTLLTQPRQVFIRLIKRSE